MNAVGATIKGRTVKNFPKKLHEKLLKFLFRPQQSYDSSSREAAVSPRTVEGSGVGAAVVGGGGGTAAAAGGAASGPGGGGAGPAASLLIGVGSAAGAARYSQHYPLPPPGGGGGGGAGGGGGGGGGPTGGGGGGGGSALAAPPPPAPSPHHHLYYYPAPPHPHHLVAPGSSVHHLQAAAAAAAAQAAASSSSPALLAMNSGPAGGPGQPPPGLQTSSSSSGSRDQHSQGNDPSGIQNITVMNITVPPVMPVSPAALRFVHPSYHLPPPPGPTHPHQGSQSVLTQVQTYGSSASPVSVSSSITQTVSRHAPVSNSSSTTYSTKDIYRNSGSVNDRVSISVSSSVPSQVIGNEYVVSGRGDRPRISLLPAPASITPSASPTAPADYHAMAAAAARNNRTGGSAIMLQPQDYRPSPVDMVQLHQDTPPFKKIRLSGQPTQLPPTTQPTQQTSSQPPEPPRITSGQDTIIKQKHVQLPPLKIDTRPPAGAYTPQTEAISPTLPETNTQEDAAFRTTKDDLLQQISKIDREISQRDSQISKLRKKLIELEEVAKQPLDTKGEKEEASQQPKHQSLAQKIYADNRKKAEQAHRQLEKQGLKVRLPLYNQPSDTTMYQENRARHLILKPRLVARLRREYTNRAAIQREASRTYARLVQEWHRKVERLESTQKRKTKEAKNREFFEKVFPELRKQREDKERFNRVGARIKSEADLEEIMDGLQEQEMEDKKMRSYAVIPPLLLDAKQRKIAYQNRNGLLQPEELEALHGERKLINVWSQGEHELFKEKYLQHPKSFGAIAQSFEHKSAPDCVHHYYLTKKTENYKQLLRKSRRTRNTRNNPNNKVNHNNSTIGPIDILTTGVTTRLQREQQQKTQENPHSSSVTSSSSSVTTSSSAITSSSSSTSVTSSSSITTTTSSTSAVASASSSGGSSSVGSTSVSSESSTTTATTTTVTSTASSVAASASVPSTSVTTTTSSVLTTTSTSSASAKDAREANKENKEIKQEPKDSILHKDIKEESQSSSETVSSREIKTEGKGALSSSSNASIVNINLSTNLQHEQQKDKKKNIGITSGVSATSRSKDKKKENHTAPMETSDEESQSMDTSETSGRQLGPHPCAVCHTMVEAGNQSRPLARSQASQYGLREDQVALGARVCNNCRCKSVRGRLTTCPLPGCPNLNSSGANAKQRVKRLRALPPKWYDLPPEIRDPIIQEFQIPSSTTKCCSACFNRISRRLASHFSSSTTDGTDDVDALARQWSEEELEKLRKALREHGTNWAKVAEQIAGKTNHQCKNYYLAYRKKLGLDQVVAEYYQSLGEERRPCLTDEEESGSSTSSCDELAVHHDSSDTASAGSPVNTISSSTPSASTVTSATSMPFSQSQDTKVGDKLADVAVVSLVAPTPLTSSQTPQTNPPTSTREDYDSSATETADEGQGSADLENTGVVVTLTTPSCNTSSNPPPSHQAPQNLIHAQPAVPSPPSAANSNNPLTVKDLMLGVIEMQLKRNQNSPGTNSSVPVSSGTPTISSILKTDPRNEITFMREYKPSQQSQQPSISNTAIPNRDPNLATLSVVSGPHHGHRTASSPHQIGQMQATITPCPPSSAGVLPQPGPPPPSQDMIPKEGLVVMQQPIRDTEGTLDLSIKKPRQPQEYNHTLQPPPPHKPSVIPTYQRTSEPPPTATYYPAHAHPDQSRSVKSPHVYAPSPRPPAPLTPKINKVTLPPTSHPKLSPKLTNMGSSHKTGSITHGTPVSGARYDGMMRQTPPGSTSQPNPSTTPVGSKETGSITQGTPVHPYAVDKRAPMYADYSRSIRHSPVTTSNVSVPPPNSGVVVSHGQSGQYNTYQSRQAPSYTMEQQLSSRQIIMNDYITSQQMHPRNRSSGSAEVTVKTEPPTTLYCASTPPPPQPHPQARQGVIQRHNTQKHYPPPPPGLEAFSSLVDVAVQQPSLPVPHPPTSRGSEGLCISMERMYGERYASMPRLARQQAAQYQMAVAMEQRDFILREKQEEEQRLHREKEQQQQQQQLHQQHIERMAVHQREKEIQQHQEHRLAQQEMQVAAAAAAQQQREKEIQQQQQSHVDHRLSIHQQTLREKEVQQVQQHYRLVHQREKELQQQIAAAAQREKEHEHRMVVQREKEIQHQQQQQQQQELRLVQQKREKEMRQQQVDHNLAVQREYLQQQQRYQKQQMHIQQQHRIHQQEAERRLIVQFNKEHEAQQQLYRDYAERQCESPSMAKGGFYQPRIQPPPPQPPPPSRHGQSSTAQQGDSSTLTAASLIDAIITHQINQTAATAGGAPPTSNQPTRPGDRLFQGFHQDSPAEPNGMAHSPAGEENTSNRDSSAGSGASGANKALTLGEHVDHIVNKDYGPPMSSYRPYAGYQISEDQWKRRKGGESDSTKSSDERQIIRVAQQKPPMVQPQQAHPSQQSVSKQGQPTYHTEPVSPPEPTTNHYQRRFYEPGSASTTTPVTVSSKSHLSPLDYVKNKIVEVMRTEDDKSSLGDRNGGASGNDKDDKADSSPSGEMVIDESPNQPQVPSTQSSQQPPPPAPTTFYPFNALGVHTGPPPAPPPTGGGTPVAIVKTEEPAPLLSAQYEPLSDED